MSVHESTKCDYNSAKVEDPTTRSTARLVRWAAGKHLRHAAFLGMHDSVLGSSANVLTGGSVDFGTSGFGLLLDGSALNPPT